MKENRDDENKRSKLSDEDLLAYRQAVEEVGEPDSISKDSYEPNKSLQVIWDLNDKYGFGLRFVTEITEDGYLQYSINRN